MKRNPSDKELTQKAIKVLLKKYPELNRTKNPERLTKREVQAIAVAALWLEAYRGDERDHLYRFFLQRLAQRGREEPTARELEWFREEIMKWIDRLDKRARQLLK